jgi:hypothetical protein
MRLLAGRVSDRHIWVLPGRDDPGSWTSVQMLGFLSRFVGLWLIAGALVAAVIDATKTIAASKLTVTALGEAWASVGMTSLLATQTFVQQSVEPVVGRWVWDPVLQTLLLLPAWAVLGALGFLFTWLGRRRREKVVYA